MKYANTPMRLSFRPIQPQDVKQFFGWRYAPPYDIYDLGESISADKLAYYLDPAYQYHAILDEADTLLAFCSFGEDGRVPGGDYSADALDIGIGVRPDLTGKGQGARFVRAVLEFALAKFEHTTLRVTIASFNKRAQRVCEKAGFVEIGQFGRKSDNQPFIIYTRHLNQEKS